MILTIDASVAIKWVIDEPDTKQARSFLPALVGGVIHIEHVLLAPALIALELHHAIAKRCRRGEATFEQLANAETALGFLDELAPIDAALTQQARFISFVSKHRKAAALGQALPGPEAVFNIYDCVYVAHALQKQSRLVTADREQAEIATALGIPVEFIAGA